MPETSIVLFDGVCNLCSSSVVFIIKRDPVGRFKFVSLQSPVAKQLLTQCGRPPDDLTSIVLLQGARCRIKSDAVLEIARGLKMPWALLYGLRAVPRFLRDAIYDVIVRHRYRWFGKNEFCMVPTAELRSRFLD